MKKSSRPGDKVADASGVVSGNNRPCVSGNNATVAGVKSFKCFYTDDQKVCNLQSIDMSPSLSNIRGILMEHHFPQR